MRKDHPLFVFADLLQKALGEAVKVQVLSFAPTKGEKEATLADLINKAVSDWEGQDTPDKARMGALISKLLADLGPFSPPPKEEGEPLLKDLLAEPKQASGEQAEGTDPFHFKDLARELRTIAHKAVGIPVVWSALHQLAIKADECHFISIGNTLVTDNAFSKIANEAFATNKGKEAFAQVVKLEQELLEANALIKGQVDKLDAAAKRIKKLEQWDTQTTVHSNQAYKLGERIANLLGLAISGTSCFYKGEWVPFVELGRLVRKVEFDLV